MRTETAVRGWYFTFCVFLNVFMNLYAVSPVVVVAFLVGETS